MTFATGSKLGPYEIVSPIGAGGMGEVYRARDPRVGRDVAVKVTAEKFTERFEREIHAVAALNHPNIATLYDVGPNYLVMELVEGPTLAERIEQGAIPLEESLTIARQIADALEAAHEKGIVHRDLKPGNIKIKPDGTVKVLDFGLAKVEETAAVSLETSPTLSVAQTAAGVILGTAAYMSPEQARGKTVDKRADIWAFGVILYEMLTGKRLFGGDTVSDTLAAVLKEEPEWDKVPAKVRPLLRRCLEKDPKERLRDIGEAMAWIEKAPDSVSPQRPWPAWIAAAVCLLVALTCAFLYFREKAPASTEALRLQIAVPEKVRLDWGGAFAVSPDGRHLAFAVAGSDGVVRLWIRDLDSLEARPLASTESPHIPPFFWSPDSRFIAFDAGGKLKKIDITGGPAQVLCDLSENAVGGSWNREGVIIFGTTREGLKRVSAAGGAVSVLSRPDPARHVISQAFPTFLPDGRHFLYFQSSDKPEIAGVYVGSLDSKPEEQGIKHVLATGFGHVYAPPQNPSPGQIFFLRGHTLMSQQFDDKRLEVSGDPVLVADQVGSFARSGYFSASANGILVYRSSGAEPSGQAMWFDRQGKGLGAAAEPLNLYELALSPDNTRVAVSLLNTLQISVDIWLLDSARGIKTRLTFGGSNHMPIWSPDGSHLVFASSRNGPYDLYRKAVSGIKDEELLFKSSDSKVPTSWSSDVRFLLYTAVDPKTKCDLWVLPLDGDRKPMPFLRTEFNESDGHFSPDMRWVAYVSDESSSDEIYVRGFSQTSGSSSDTGGKWQVSVSGGTGPRWRKDGRELYYRAPDGKVMVVDVTAGTEFRSGTPKPLFQAPPDLMASLQIIPLSQWDVASDGSRFLISTPAAETTPAPFTVVLNWQAGLKK